MIVLSYEDVLITIVAGALVLLLAYVMRGRH